MTVSIDTIAAISTPPGTGAIAVVRISGLDAIAVAEIFRSGNTGKSIATSAGEVSTGNSHDREFKPNMATHGFIFDPHSGESIDEVVLTAFRAPNTYTGEDLVEISCHGGSLITAEILALVLNCGSRLARRGEFTQRAFLAGKLDLTQAEAVLDIIQAKTSRQSRRALSTLVGALGERINKVRAELVVLLTRIVAGIDFPEEIGDAPEPEIGFVTTTAITALQELAKTARTGRYLRDGLKIAIVGPPNAGKSSLLNQLLKFERAIVTDIPGTTRDSLEEMLDLNGIPLILVDTAGIRPTEDQVEMIGIERSKKAIAECDLALFIYDMVQGLGEPETEIGALLCERPYLLIGNKMDAVTADNTADNTVNNLTANEGSSGRQDSSHRPFISELCTAHLAISAKTGQQISQLTNAIESFVFQDESMREGPSLNARQAELCLKAVAALKLVESTLEAGFPQDCLATDLKSAVDALSEISGQSVSEEVIKQVFATFCIGK